MTAVLPVPTLSGRLVRLEPLSERHADDLLAESADRSTFGWADVPASSPEAVGKYIRLRQTMHGRGEWLPFAQVRVADERAVGCTMLGNFRRPWPDQPPYATEIGSTWLGASAQRSGINVEAKLLLLTHAFDELRVGR